MSTTDYHPTDRRPIAELFRATARLPVRWCVRTGIHPDVISYASVVAAIGAAACFLFSSSVPLLLVFAVLLCVARLWCNMLDGMVAVAARKASMRGELVNELPDRISDVVIFVGVAHSGLGLVLLGYWTAIAALLTAYVGMLSQAIGAGRQFSGLMSKPWRMLVLIIGSLVAFAQLGLNSQLQSFWGLTIIDWTCLIVIGGCVQTIGVRILRTVRNLSDQQGSTTIVDPSETASPPVGVSASPLLQAGTLHKATLWDGTSICYRAWPAATPTDKAVFLFHRGHEHSGRFQDFVERADLKDVSFFAWDARGHGESVGERGYAPSVDCLIRDLNSFVHHVCQQHDVSVENCVVVGNSIAAVLAAAWVHDYAPPIRGIVLVTPALRVKLYVPFAMFGLRLLMRMKPKSFVTSYVKSSMLTHDPQMAAEYDNDPLITRNIAVNILLGLHDTSTRLLADAGAIDVPTLILTAGSDWVVKQRPQWQLCERLSSAAKEIVVYPGFSHAVLHEKDRDLPIAKIRQFITEVLGNHGDSARKTHLNADKHSYSKDVYDRLSVPLSSLSPKSYYFNLVKCLLKTVGQMSKGISIGCQHGFDSGVSLDHVYRNKATGISVLGRCIDRIYLNSPGWSGVRQRKANLQKLLEGCIQELHERDSPIRILDVAAGPGRYLLDTLCEHREKDITALLQDQDSTALELGKQIAEQLGIAHKVTYQLGDAFDASALEALMPRPNITIISGLFELFPDNAPIRDALNGIGEVMQEDGYIIYTNQPWHPQHELIARTLCSHRGGPWIMRCRSQKEIDQLVAAVGFKKTMMEIDEEGIFSVSVATR